MQADPHRKVLDSATAAPPADEPVAPFEVVLDPDSPPGDVIGALARLLLQLARRRLAEQQNVAEPRHPGSTPVQPEED